MGLDQPAIGRVKRATNQKERIENVTESLHSKARITKPKPKPSNNFNTKTFVKIMRRKIILGETNVQTLRRPAILFHVPDILQSSAIMR
jgi:hypothetical protein